MTSREIRCRLGGHFYRFRYTSRPIVHEGHECDGICYDDRRLILVTPNPAKPKEELETVIHELLHAVDPTRRDWWVTKAAYDIAQVLNRLGYRKDTDQAEVT